MFLVSLNSSAIFLSMILGIFGKFGIEIGDPFVLIETFFVEKKTKKDVPKKKCSKKSLVGKYFLVEFFSINLFSTNIFSSTYFDPKFSKDSKNHT